MFTPSIGCTKMFLCILCRNKHFLYATINTCYMQGLYGRWLKNYVCTFMLCWYHFSIYTNKKSIQKFAVHTSWFLFVWGISFDLPQTGSSLKIKPFLQNCSYKELRKMWQVDWITLKTFVFGFWSKQILLIVYSKETWCFMKNYR